MTLSFFPPRETVSIRATPDSATTLLHFSANFSSKAEYDAIKRGGGIVELWTDISDSQGVEGKWRAISFEDWDTTLKTSIHSTETLSFGPKYESTSDSKVLHLQLAVPNSSGKRRYQYTHRITYPRFGNIKWLGDYGRDGVLVIAAGEIPAGSDRSKTTSSGTGDSKDRQVAQLSSDVDWSVFAIQGNGSARVCSLADAILPNTVMTVFTPLVRPNTFVVPPTLSLAVTRGSQISVNDRGSILVIGKSSVFLQSHSAGTEHRLLKNTIEDSLSFSSVHDYHRALDSDTASCDAIIMSSEGSTPKTMSIIPLSNLRLPAVRTIRVQLNTLAALVPPGTTELSLFPPGSADYRYLRIPSGHDADSAIDLMVGPGCSELVIAPAYDMGPWQASVMTSHKLITKDPEESIHSLLTPPPSPKVSTVLGDVSEPVSAMPLPAQRNTDTRTEQLVEQDTTAAAIPPSALARKSTSGIISYLTLIASFIVWLLKAGLVRCLRSFVMLSLRRGSSGEIRFHEEEKEIGDGDAAADVDEVTVVSQDIEPSVEEDERSVSTAADQHVSNEADDEGEKHRAPPFSSSLLLDIPAGEIRMLLKPSIAGQSVEDIRIALDGKPVTALTQVFADGASLIRFSGGESGGRVSLFAL